MKSALGRKALQKAKALLTLALGVGLALGGNALPSQAAVTSINITADSLTQSAASAVVPTLTATLSGTVATALNVTCNVYATSDTGFTTPLDQASLAVGTYKIHCTGVTTNAASYSVGTSTDGVLTVVANASLPCNADYYQMGKGVLYKFNSPTFVYNAVSTANTFGTSTTVVNSLGWNPEDNYLYGIVSNSLYKIDVNGKSVPAPVSPSNAAVGVPIYNMSAGSSASNAPTRTSAATSPTIGNTGGDFLKIGNSYYLVSASSSGFFVTDVRSRTLVKTITPTNAWNAYDITFVRNGSTSVGWGVQNNSTSGKSDLYKATITGTDIASLAISVTSTQLSAAIGSSGENFGASYSDIDGNVYAYGNSSNKLYEIPKAELTKTNPTATLVTTTTATVQSPNDGADCPNASSPTAATLTTSTPATSITSTSANVAGTVLTPNLPGADVTAGNLQFCYATSVLSLSNSPTCVSATPSSTAQNTTPAAGLSASLSGLTPSTTYYFQTKAVNSGGSTSFGEVRNFTTLNTWNLSANSSTYTIGGAVPTLGATASPSAGINGSATCNAYSSSDTGYSTALTISSLSAGTYVIHCTATSASGYTLGTNNNGTLTVTSLMGWTITGNNQTYQTPGTAPSASGVASPSAGLGGSLTCNYYANTDTGYATPLTISSSTAPGTYVVRCTGTAAAGYAPAAINNGVLTVTQTPWYLNATDATYTIGGTLPGLTSSASISAALSGSASCSIFANSDTSYRTALTLDATLPAGTYVIRCTGSAATGYAAPTINNGVLTVTSLTSWTLTAANANYTIGGTAPTLTATANPAGGLSGSYTCRVYANSDPTYSTPLTVDASLAAGTYVIRCTGSAASGYAGATVVNGTLTVSVAAVSYSVTYDANNSTGGQVPTDSGSYNSGSTVTVKSNSGSLVRTGYTFGGWNTAANGSGGTYAATGSATFTITSNVTLYAVWNINSFTVTYNENDGSGTTATASKNYGDTDALTFSNPWTRTGYTFVGWATTSGATSAASSYTVTGAVTLYAVWQANSYTITYNKNDGSGTTATASKNYGATDALTFSNPWTRTGYTFIGWATTSGAISAALSYSVTGNANLYAIWQINSFVVTFDKNDGSATTTTNSYNYGATTALSYSNPWTRTGYTFLGWSTISSATTPDNSHTVTGTVTLYAVWQQDAPNSFSITYDANDGSGSTHVGVETQGSTTALTHSNPWTREGYTFLGWATTSGATAPATSYTVTGNANLYAVWQINSYTITYNKNDGSGTTTTHSYNFGATNALSFANPWTRTGYTFLGWGLTSSSTVAETNYTVTGAATLYAVWQINSYTITYTKNDGSGTTATASKNYGDTDALTYSNPWTRTGYTFLGWATTSGATSAVSSYTVAGNANLYAVWQINSYTITYEENDGSGTTTTHSYNFGATNALSFANPWTRTGYTFAGWSTNAYATVADATYTVSDIDNLFAIWEANSYVITFAKNDGSGTTTTRNYTYNQTNALGFTNPWNRTGYTFLGWATTPGARSAASSFIVTGTATLYAVWLIDTYTVTYDENAGGSNSTTNFYDFDSTSALSFANPWTRTGYTFLGWSINASAAAADTSFTVTGDATLYAIWKIKTYTITYDKNDGSNARATRNYDHFATDALNYNNPWTRAGYTFIGWSVDSTATAADVSFTVVANASLYAVWQVNNYTITYSSNDGASNTTTVSKNFGSTNALSFANPWTRTGYSFLGWATTAGARSPATSFSVSGDATLFAVWAIDTFVVTYDANDSSSRTTDETFDYGYTGALGYSHPWNRTGYTFVGWSIDPAATTPDSSLTITAAVTLYAIWSQNPVGSFTINYTKNDGTPVNHDVVYTDGATNALTFTNPFVRPGYTFLGWATTDNATAPATSYTVTADAELYAVWQIEAFTITYDKNTGATEDASFEYGDVSALNHTTAWSRYGFRFVGWSIDPNATEADSSFMVTGSTTLYAVWVVADPASLSEFPNRTKSVTIGSYTLVPPTSNSQGVVTYSANCPGVAIVIGNVVSFLAPGVCQITATVADAPGFSANSITMILTITPAIIYIPVTPPTGSGPTITPDPNSNLYLEYKKPQGKVTLTSTNGSDPNENWTLILRGLDKKGKVTPLDAHKRLEFESGNKAATSGTGFMPGTTVGVFLGTKRLGNVLTNDTGSFTAAFTIPQSIKRGILVIQVNGITNNNTVRSVSLPVVFKGIGLNELKKAVYFLGDSPKVTGHGGMVLQAIWALLKGKKNIVVNVSGWVKETADKSHDIKLSYQRAQNMVHVLRDIYKIKAKYSYKGYGISPEGTDKSRRADIVITFTN